MNEKINELLSKMTLEEKAGLCSGKDFWWTKSVERLNVPPIMVSDGPCGLRTQIQTGINENDCISAVSFPSGCAIASSFDRDLIQKEGEILGNESNAQNVAILLGPAINIKRSPLCGRNFEYLSEDPYLAGEIGAAFTKGVQSQNVGVSVKHFAANNQEFRRYSVSESIGERALREIYLNPFENIVKNASPKTIMCSYNAINGNLSSENKWLLQDVLRDEWGFKGFVISDWGSVNDRVKGIIAGLNLEMPYSGGLTDSYIVQAVKDGTITENRLNEIAGQILEFVFEYTENKKDAKWDKEQDHLLSSQIAEECCVLLKNEDKCLPLNPDCKNNDVLFVGEFAQNPRYEGGGSSNIKSFKVTSALDAVKQMNINVDYCKGDDIDEVLQKSKKAKTVVIFTGLPNIDESEGFDRETLDMPKSQNELIEQIANINKNVVVVLHNGSPILMTWKDKVKSILECYLGGDGIGLAQVRLLFGYANPSGKLSETFPLRLEDTPCYLDFPGNGRQVNYSEGIFVGYRWYDSRKIDVLFPFGHGLSYTNFEYSKIELDKSSIKDDESVEVSVKIRNTGDFDGKEVVQVYVRDLTNTEIRPDKELKGFEKVFVKKGEEKTVKITLSKRSFAYWSVDLHDWYVPTGEFEILVGSSSKDIKDSAIINLKSTTKRAFEITRWTTPGDMMNNAEMKPIITEFMKTELGEKYSENDSISSDEVNENVAFSSKTLREMYLNDPFRVMRGRKGRTDEDIDKIILDFNKKLLEN